MSPHHTFEIRHSLFDIHYSKVFIASRLRNSSFLVRYSLFKGSHSIAPSRFIIQIFSSSEHHPFKNARFHHITPSKFDIPCSIFIIQIFSYSEYHVFKGFHFHSITPSKFDIPCSIFVIQIDTKKVPPHNLIIDRRKEQVKLLLKLKLRMMHNL